MYQKVIDTDRIWKCSQCDFQIDAEEIDVRNTFAHIVDHMKKQDRRSPAQVAAQIAEDDEVAQLAEAFEQQLVVESKEDYDMLQDIVDDDSEVDVEDAGGIVLDHDHIYSEDQVQFIAFTIGKFTRRMYEEFRNLYLVIASIEFAWLPRQLRTLHDGLLRTYSGIVRFIRPDSGAAKGVTYVDLLSCVSYWMTLDFLLASQKKCMTI